MMQGGKYPDPLHHEIAPEKLALALSDMLVCKQMIRAILIIALALRAEAELQRRGIQLRSAAYRAFVLCDAGAGTGFPHLCPKCLSAVYLMRRIATEIPRGEEKHHKA